MSLTRVIRIAFERLQGRFDFGAKPKKTNRPKRGKRKSKRKR